MRDGVRGQDATWAYNRIFRRQWKPFNRGYGIAVAEALDRLSMLIERLKPLDRQIIVSYLEGMDASSIGELTGLSPANIAIKVHRIKNILRRWFVEGGLHAE